MSIYFRNFKNIVIDGPTAHQRDTVEQLNRVGGTWTGWAVLRSIIDTQKTLTIAPFSADDQRRVPDAGAFVRPVGFFGAVNGTPAGEVRFLGRDDDPSTPQ